MSKKPILVPLTATVWLAASVGMAQSFDPALDFSANTNANGVWSYGYSLTLGSPLILHTDRLNVNGVDIWRTDLGSGDPLASHNPTTNVVNLFNTVSMNPGEFGMHPGPDGEYAILRFTAPSPGQYHVSGSFYGQDTAGTTTDVHILVNGLSVVDGEVTGFGPDTGPSFATTVKLKAGDNLDFAVGFGNDGNYYNDTTGLSAQIVLLPDLAINANGPHSLVLSWPTNTAGFTLEQNPDLTTTNWVPVTNAVVMMNGMNQVTLSVTNDNLFFRLKR